MILKETKKQKLMQQDSNVYRIRHEHRTVQIFTVKALTGRAPAGIITATLGRYDGLIFSRIADIRKQ